MGDPGFAGSVSAPAVCFAPTSLPRRTEPSARERALRSESEGVCCIVSQVSPRRSSSTLGCYVAV